MMFGPDEPRQSGILASRLARQTKLFSAKARFVSRLRRALTAVAHQRPVGASL
jgi:hypothetical protein